MFGRLTPVVKNLLLINIGIYLINVFFRLGFNNKFGFYGFLSDKFEPYQLFTYMFLHDESSFFHLFGNMLGLFFFGPILESFWGASRFLKYYLITGIGAAILYSLVNLYEARQIQNDTLAYIENPSDVAFFEYLGDHYPHFRQNERVVNFAYSFESNPENQELIENSKEWVKGIGYSLINADIPMVGASGAIFGLLMGMFLLFPNTEVFLLFFPFPIKIKYIVMFYSVYAIFGALHKTPGDNVAHYAHLGGMLVGLVLIKIWNKSRNDFY